MQACAAMFGIGIAEDIEIVLYEDLVIDLAPGTIIYLTGDSGAGKSTLLNDIRSKVHEHPDLRTIEDTAVEYEHESYRDVPLVDQFDMPIKETLELLNFVGISEAFVFLRKPGELSDGQRYRFRLAMMVHRATHVGGLMPVICMDEFLAVLDRETARNVAYQVRRVASKFGLCFVVATTHVDIAADLDADLTITMRLNLPVELRRTPSPNRDGIHADPAATAAPKKKIRQSPGGRR